MADSFIWRVRTEKVGSLEPFKSEFDMEAFLMNNPALIGCWDPGDESQPPCLIRQQLSTRTGKGAYGRIDLVGLVTDENERDYILKIFELKVGQITVDSIRQLVDYLKGWDKQDSARQLVQSWLLETGFEEPALKNLLDNPKGVVVGSSFAPEAISEAIRHGIEGIRLARFRAESESEYFVIIENQIGGAVGDGKSFLSWKDVGLSTTDTLYLEIERQSQKGKDRQKIAGTPAHLDKKFRKLTLSDESISALLKNEDKILAKHDGKWIRDGLKSLKLKGPIALSTATALAFWAFDDGREKSWATPASWWTLKRTGETLAKIDSRYR